MSSWNFHTSAAVQSGTEPALDVSEYFLDEANKRSQGAHYYDYVFHYNYYYIFYWNCL